MQPPTWISSGSTDTSTSVTTPDAGPGLFVGVAGTATTCTPLASPVTVAKAAEIQQKLPGWVGFFTYHQLPSGFFPTISALCPAASTTTTEKVVSGPTRQLSPPVLGEANGTVDPAAVAVALGSGIGVKVGVSVKPAPGVVADGRLQAKTRMAARIVKARFRFFMGLL